jgi:tetratricopeptide (TPR) repeat protein
MRANRPPATGNRQPAIINALLPVACCLLPVACLLWATPARAKTKPRPEASAYLEEMEKRGLVDKTAVTAEALAKEVEIADRDLVAGNPTLAAARLYGIVEGPRYQDFAETEDFQDAEYRLGLALHRGGGSASARHYLAKSLARGAKAPYYHAALRAYADVCLEGRILKECVAELDRLGAQDVGEEIAYLRGREAYESNRFDEAEGDLKRVSPKSRFYSSALYLRGVMRVKKRDLKGAQDAFCAIADVKDGDTIRFYIDGRYYALRDLARLGLGRVAHEQGRYDDAFYHYFLIPQDSPRLGEALFEAAWSSLQRKEHDLGARLAEEFLKLYPRSPKAAEARLLFATLQVKTCRFLDAEKGFSEFITRHEPLIAAIDRALADPGTRQSLGQKLLAREANPSGPPPADEESRIAELLEVDARFFRLQALARGLRAEARDAGHVVRAWNALVAKVSGTQVQPVAAGTLDAATLLRRTDELASEIARTRAALRGKNGSEAVELGKQISALSQRQHELAATLTRVLDVHDQRGEKAGATGLLPMVKADAEGAADLEKRAAALTSRLDGVSGDLIQNALVELRAHLEGLLRRARLGKIDAVVGAKRKLEREIENLAAGRFPPEMFGKLHIEGLIQDDEEYWPPEPEIWLDEYENYK